MSLWSLGNILFFLKKRQLNSLSIRWKINKLDFMKMDATCLSNDITKEMKRKATDWEKTLVIYTCNWGLDSDLEFIKHVYKSVTKKTQINPFKKGQRVEQTHYNRISEYPVSIWRDVHRHQSSWNADKNVIQAHTHHNGYRDAGDLVSNWDSPTAGGRDRQRALEQLTLSCKAKHMPTM